MTEMLLTVTLSVTTQSKIYIYVSYPTPCFAYKKSCLLLAFTDTVSNMLVTFAIGCLII